VKFLAVMLGVLAPAFAGLISQGPPVVKPGPIPPVGTPQLYEWCWDFKLIDRMDPTEQITLYDLYGFQGIVAGAGHTTPGLTGSQNTPPVPLPKPTKPVSGNYLDDPKAADVTFTAQKTFQIHEVLRLCVWSTVAPPSPGTPASGRGMDVVTDSLSGGEHGPPGAPEVETAYINPAPEACSFTLLLFGGLLLVTLRQRQRRRRG